MTSQPEFHLRRVESDGSGGPLEVCTWSDLPPDLKASRRGFVGAGLTIGALLNVLGRTPQATAADDVKPQGVVNAHKKSVEDLLFTADGQLVSCSADHTVKIWSLVEGKCRHTLAGHTESVNALAITPRGDLLASASRDKSIRLWSVTNGQLLRSVSAPAMIDALVITPDGKTLISGGWDKTIQLWSLPDGKPIQKLSPQHGPVYSLAVSPDGKLLASAGGDKKVRLWTLPDGKIHKTTGGHDSKVEALSFSSDGTLLASGGWDQAIKLWNTGDGNLHRKVTGHTAGVDALAASPRGGRLVSGAWDHTLKLWTLPEGNLVKTLVGHRDQVNCVAISPEGALLASGDRQGVILLWSMITGDCLGFLFDPEASQSDALTYSVQDKSSGRVFTYTLPCGAPTPAGATCVCNCVPGTYRPPSPVVATRTPTRREVPVPDPSVNRAPYRRPVYTPPYYPYIPPYYPPAYYPGGYSGGSTYCSCNKICTCIPVCQAHRLLHPDPVVRTLAEQLMLIMGRAEFRYMGWAAQRAAAGLKSRILGIVSSIRAGARFNPLLAPAFADCVARLDDPDEVIAIMAAQMIGHRWSDRVLSVDHQLRVAELLETAARRPWYLRD